MKHIRFNILVLLAVLAISLVPNVTFASQSDTTAPMTHQEADECYGEIVAGLMEFTGVTDAAEFEAGILELSDEEVGALLEEAGLAEAAADCEFEYEFSCDILVTGALVELTGIEDAAELETHLSEMPEEELAVLVEDATDLIIGAALMDATGIEDEEELVAHLEGLSEEELDTLLDESGIYAIGEACASPDDLEDLSEECLVTAMELLMEATGAEDEETLVAGLEELSEEELSELLDESGVYEVVATCDADVLGDDAEGEDGEEVEATEESEDEE